MQSKKQKQQKSLDRIEQRIFDACVVRNLNEVRRQIALANEVRSQLNQPHLSIVDYDLHRGVWKVVAVWAPDSIEEVWAG